MLPLTALTVVSFIQSGVFDVLIGPLVIFRAVVSALIFPSELSRKCTAGFDGASRDPWSSILISIFQNLDIM